MIFFTHLTHFFGGSAGFMHALVSTAGEAEEENVVALSDRLSTLALVLLVVLSPVLYDFVT